MHDQALPQLPSLLKDALAELMRSGFDTFRAGGAIGFDTLAALTVLELKASFPHVRLELYLPCRDQDARWFDNEKRLYYSILQNADSIHYTAESYSAGCMLQRNREMLRGSHLCIAYCLNPEGRGGTAYTVRYARKQGITLLNLAEQLPPGVS